MLKKIVSKIFSRLVITLLLVALQVSFFIFELVELANYYAYISMFFSLISILVVFYLISRNMNPSVKLAWIVPILMFPVFGGLMWLIYGRAHFSKNFKEKYGKAAISTKRALVQDDDIADELGKDRKTVANQCGYIYRYENTPVYKNTSTEYYKTGEEFYASLLAELKKAEKYIFMEYYIIERGEMWDSILEILKEKVNKGVEVRLMYDDVGCINKIPSKYYEELNEAGIQTVVFNRVFPVLITFFNYRDHRKITVIDGKVGFTGGVNLADEYINKVVRFGKWKDAAVKIEGDAVWSLAAMFLQMWNSTKMTEEDYSQYKYEFPENTYSDGYVQPYKDEPLDKELVGEFVYMNIINNAKDYVYIYTPYLIIDNELKTSLMMASKRGVDVRIVTPGIPDKKTVYYLTQSYYEDLINAGVKIYQYAPGFIHSKCFLCDDDIAVVGTINMDYRSLYHHFECGIYFYKASVCKTLKEDMINTFEESCLISKEWCRKNIRSGILGPVLKLLAPMM